MVLEVPGRRSGLIRRTTLVQVRHEGEHYLVALAGESEWVRNVRAPVLRAYLLRSGRRAGSRAVAGEARYYFGVSPDPSLDEPAAVGEHYPVFRVVGHGATTTPA